MIPVIAKVSQSIRRNSGWIGAGGGGGGGIFLAAETAGAAGAPWGGRDLGFIIFVAFFGIRNLSTCSDTETGQSV